MTCLNLCGKKHKACFVIFVDKDTSSPLPQPVMAFFSSIRACLKWLVHHRELSDMSAYNASGNTIAYTAGGKVTFCVV